VPVVIAALAGSAASRDAIAQPIQDRAPAAAGDSGEIEMESAVAPPAAPDAPVAPVRDPRLARRWLATAQQLMQRGSYLAAKKRPDDARTQFENAVAAYRKAIDASDDPNLFLDLANAEDKLGKPCDAVKHLRRLTGRSGPSGVTAATGAAALNGATSATGATSTIAPRPDVLKKAASRLDELSAKVGVVTLVVKPAGASITLGGAELGTAPLAEPLVLLPGTYTLSFQAEGFQPREAALVVEGGTEAERAVELEAVRLVIAPVPPLAPVPARSDAAPPDALGQGKLPLYVGAGITGAAATSAVIFGVLALRQHATFTGASTSPAAREDARTNGQRFALVSDVSLGAAVIAAGFTAYWYVARYRPSRARMEAKLDVVPWVQPQSGGAAIAGWF
jgi:hypothetical protein